VYVRKGEDGRTVIVLTESDRRDAPVNGTSSNGRHMTFRTEYGSYRVRRIDKEYAAVFSQMPFLGGMVLFVVGIWLLTKGDTTDLKGLGAAFWGAAIVGLVFVLMRSLQEDYRPPWIECCLLMPLGYILEQQNLSTEDALAYSELYLGIAVTFIALALVFYVVRGVKRSVWESLASALVLLVFVYAISFAPVANYAMGVLALVCSAGSFLLLLPIRTESRDYERGLNRVHE
jgi:hypothetical protein